ncbi:MAG: translocation/assembly module TamB domain-containing protein [Desulfobulbus sp.]|nr:translocation/assembly module TamB domain-containing protein [Desulfobulbus sp.]
MKIIKRLLLGFTATLLVFCTLLLFSATTEMGLRVLIALSNSLTNAFFSIGSASGTLLGPFELRQIRYADGIDTVLIDTLQLDWQPSQLLDGQIHLHSLSGTQVQVMLGESSGGGSEETILPALYLPLAVIVDKLQVNSFILSSAGEELQTLESLSLSQLSYLGDQLSFYDCTLLAADSRMQLKGVLQTNADYLIKTTVKAQLAFNEYAPLVATATLEGPLNRLKITADLKQPSSLHLTGELNGLLGATSWTAVANSEEIALPAFNTQWPDQSFRQVSLRGQGTLKDYDLTLDAKTGVPGLPSPVAVAAVVHGDDLGLEFSRLSLTQNKAICSARGKVQWSPHFSWQANIQGSQLDPSVLLPQWPGHFSAKLVTKGEISPTLRAQVQLSDLQGTLRGYPLTGAGSMDLQGDRLTLPQCTLKSGGSRLEISGTSMPKLDLALRVHSTNLAEVLPKASGTLEAKAHLGGTLTKPELNLNIEGRKLGFDQNKIGRLSATASGSIANDGLFKATLQLSKASLSEMLLEKATLDLQGSLNKHTLKLAAANSELKTGLELQGKYAQGNWQGSLRQSHLAFAGGGDWQQQKESELFFSPKQIKLARTCLGTSRKSNVCVDGTWNGDNRPWQFQTKMTALPLAALAQSLNAPWPIQGTLNSTLQIQGKEQRVIQAHFSAETDGLQLTAPFPEGQQQKISWQSNSLRAEYGNNQLHIRLSSLINEQNSLKADMRQTTADPIGEFLTRPLQANIQLNLQDLSLLAILSDQAVIPSGTLQGAWTVKGPILSPRLSGEIHLSEGKAEVPALGITLFPLHLSLKGDRKTVEIEAMAQSGSGELRATSTLALDHPENRSAQVHLVGKDFHAAKLPSMDLTLSPDLLLTVSEKEIRVHGRVNIPKAQVTSINFDQATAPSSDVVVIDEGTPISTSNQPLFLNLDLITGEEVNVDAYGLRGKIKGNLRIDGQPGRPMLGTGTLSVNKGTFSLYGKRLKIDVGRVLYTGGPLTNPGIELRSERKTDKATTGVTIEGFLQNPEISFYSTPAMEQSAIIQNLLEDTAIGGETREDIGVVGTAAEKIGLGGLVPYLQSLKKLSMIDEIKLESGDDSEDRSLVFGSWLTPDLYVSYGKDLVKESGTFNTKLNLGHGFSLLTETGSSQSGGDIKYELER